MPISSSVGYRLLRSCSAACLCPTDIGQLQARMLPAPGPEFERVPAARLGHVLRILARTPRNRGMGIPLTADSHAQLANFIWSICNLLRGPYKRNEYRKVILPLTVLRRFDCLLAPTKAQVLAAHPSIKIKPETVVRSLLEQITGRPF